MGKQQQQKKAAPVEEAAEALTRLGKVKHPTLGECVRVRLRAWEGPVYVGQKGRHVFTEHLFPRDQGRFGAPPLLVGYDDAGQRSVTVSSGVSYHSDLRKYGNFRMGRPTPV